MANCHVIQSRLGIRPEPFEEGRRHIDQRHERPEPARQELDDRCGNLGHRTAVSGDRDVGKTRIRQKPLESVPREPEEIVRLFVQWPVERAGNEDRASGLEYSPGLSEQVSRMRHVLDDLGREDDIDRLARDR